MAIFLYTDFGTGDIYVGQVKAALHHHAPGIPVIDLLHEASAFNPRANAHLLAALTRHLPHRAVVMAVVDPGVGSARRPIAVRAANRWFVGPDNGLLSVLAARARQVEIYTILWRPAALSSSFHGRDLFAPFAGMLAQEALPADAMAVQSELDVRLGGDDLAEIVYIDHFGNAMTGVRAENVAHRRALMVDSRKIRYAQVYSEVDPGELFWYENSIGLVEIASNAASAADALQLRVGQPVLLAQTD